MMKYINPPSRQLRLQKRKNPRDYSGEGFNQAIHCADSRALLSVKSQQVLFDYESNVAFGTHLSKTTKTAFDDRLILNPKSRVRDCCWNIKQTNDVKIGLDLTTFTVLF
ncbi:hypothetical protein QE152_g25740 [Popillia japonica]|uniref:Uncharacterized protein n=1 Tax=Popillia japonica TaxID=7064 RepID=A0AAW1K0Y5_POPJA